MDPDSAIARQMKDTIRQSEEIRNAWVDAVSDSVVNFRMQDGQKKNAQEGVRYSLRNTTDGKIVAVVDEDILSHLDMSNMDKATKKAAQKAAAKALLNFENGIVVDGITRKVNKVSRDEYTRSKDTIQLSRDDPDAFADKMRAASIVDDIVVATTDWARDGKLNHPRTDNFVDFDHGTTLIQSGNAQYTAEVVVGITENGEAVFYDVVDINSTKFQLKEMESHSAVTAVQPPNAITGDSTNDNVPQPHAGVNGESLKSSRTNQDSTYLELAREPEKNKDQLLRRSMTGRGRGSHCLSFLLLDTSGQKL